jgi:hypothetical protein
MLATPGPNGAPVSDPSLYDERIDIVSIAPDFKRQIAATLGAELIKSPVRGPLQLYRSRPLRL